MSPVSYNWSLMIPHQDRRDAFSLHLSELYKNCFAKEPERLMARGTSLDPGDHGEDFAKWIPKQLLLEKFPMIGTFPLHPDFPGAYSLKAPYDHTVLAIFPVTSLHGTTMEYHLLGPEAELLAFSKALSELEVVCSRPKRKKTWDDIFLPKKLRDELQGEIEEFLGNRSLYEKHKVPFRLGLMLVGPPGNGKTLTAKILASVYEMRVEEFLTPKDYAAMTPGFQTGDQNWGTAEAVTPRHLGQPSTSEQLRLALCEDLDRVLSEARPSGTPALLNIFLNKVDGIHEMDNTILFATANDDRILDTAVTRPGRFDRIFRLSAPAAEDIHEYLRVKLADCAAYGHWNVDRLAGAAQGFSYAALERLVMRCRLHNIKGKMGDEKTALEFVAQIKEHGAGAKRQVGIRAE